MQQQKTDTQQQGIDKFVEQEEDQTKPVGAKDKIRYVQNIAECHQIYPETEVKEGIATMIEFLSDDLTYDKTC